MGMLPSFISSGPARPRRSEMTVRLPLVYLLAGVVFLIGAMPVQAGVLGFYNISGNNACNAGIGIAQLSVEVTDPGTGQALFTFTNEGPLASSICDVYFDDGTLLGIASIDDSLSGVSFSQWARPHDLPAGTKADPAFETTVGFSADSDSPVCPNGVDPGEYLGILFNLKTSMGFDDVLADLENRDLRIGIHVQGFPNGGSESFINRPYVPGGSGGGDPVPEPATMLLVGIGLVGLAWSSKKKLKK